jgi:hypothetical protein
LESVYSTQLITLDLARRGISTKSEADEDVQSETNSGSNEMELDPTTQHVKYATLDQLIERLMRQSLMSDTKFTEIFFLTYRSFTSTMELMSKITTTFDDLIHDKGLGGEKKVRD